MKTIWIEIDLNQLKKNLKIIRAKLAGPGVEVLAIVKADAYGHGMKPVAKVLRKEGVRFFGVANIDEAVELRTVCPKEKILVLGSFHKSQVPLYRKHRILPTVSSLEDIEVLESVLGEGTAPFPVHVKVDTGMGRLGVWHREAEAFFKELKKRKNILVQGVYTHFANADHSKKHLTHKQIMIFNRVVKTIQKLGIRPRYRHAANSLGLLRFKAAHLNIVRPGILLYGMNPTAGRAMPKGLQPILSLKTRISLLRSVEKGRSLSYGSTYKTPNPTRIATLPVGYSHGYRVGFSNQAFVAVRGISCPVVGRVTMDQTLVDVGHVPKVERWEEVTLIGQSKRVKITAQTLANLIQTISYEITCALHSRIPRLYSKKK